MLLKASTQLLNDPCPGRTILSEDLILFKFEVTSIVTLLFAIFETRYVGIWEASAKGSSNHSGILGIRSKADFSFSICSWWSVPYYFAIWFA